MACKRFYNKTFMIKLQQRVFPAEKLLVYVNSVEDNIDLFL